jgi:hypothetical protein
MIYARSNRSIWVLAVVALGTALLLLGGALALLLAGRPWDALVVGLVGAVAAAALARLALRLRRGPLGRLALFRDRLVLLGGRLELQATWAEILTATLADHTEWGAASWPELQITERLNVRLRSGRSFSFRPKHFGLDPVACRDVILRLRDDPVTRARLPIFDSALDLAVHPLHVGELIRPQL